MADSTSILFGEIQHKIESLADKLHQQQQENSALRSENQRLAIDLHDCKAELEKSRLEVEYLSLSHNLASSPQALADARAIITGLIRKVDSAIAAIRRDPADL